MRFHIEQSIDAPMEAVEAAYTDPAFVIVLDRLPKLGHPELLDQQVDGDIVHQRIRFAFAGDLSPAVTRVIDPAKLTWVEVATLDHRLHRGEHRIEPDNYANRLECHYATQLYDDDGTTRRVADGELIVRFPLVGGRVERAIVAGMEEHAALEAAALTDWLAEKG